MESNYALKHTDRDGFVRDVTSGLSTPPVYFPLNAKINQQGYTPMDEVMDTAMQPLSVEEFKSRVKDGAWILDTRPATTFTEAFVPDSISIGLDGRFAEWAGSLLPLRQALVLVTEAGKEQESIIRLARVGIDNVQGFLQGGVEAWREAGEEIDMIIDIEADELAMDIPHDPRLEIIDVRKATEFASGHVKGAVNLPLDTLTDIANIASVDDDNNLYIHCAGGYRSVIAASLFKRQGFDNLRNVLGGFAKMKLIKGMPVVIPTTEEV
jgi:rhodanese-related sulfurtransferase